MRVLLYLLLLGCFFAPAFGQVRSDVLFTSQSYVPASQIVRDSSETIKARHLVAAGLVFTAGAVGVNWDVYQNNINLPLKQLGDNLRASYGPFHLDDYLQYAPAASYMGFGALGMGNHRFIEKTLVCATSWATMGILVNSLKYTIADLRPDGSTRNSFPSGHTATAFMGAEMVAIEYGGWYGVGAYAVATGVALMRVYNCRHWFSDLLGGAAVGALSARIGYWLLPFERKLFGIKTREQKAAEDASTGSGISSLFIVPFASGGPGGSVGLSMALQF